MWEMEAANMKLTDEEIKKMKNAALEYANPAERIYFAPFIENGILRAKDFYENQICKTCSWIEQKTGYCSVLLTYIQTKDFGCNQWEEKK